MAIPVREFLLIQGAALLVVGVAFGLVTTILAGVTALLVALCLKRDTL